MINPRVNFPPTQTIDMNAAVAATQLANDLVALAMGALMGKDPCVPPGKPEAIMLNTSPNVQIGGFPMPSWMTIAKDDLPCSVSITGGRSSKCILTD
ncbi:MAG: hypothetical protein ACFCD0_16875 [Gemmataceae bacterium]